VYYGGHPKVQYDFDALRAPVLGHWASNDDWANANIPIIREALSQRSKPCEFHTYPGTQHAFFNDQRPEVHHPAAAQLSFERTLAFFRAHLR
jgi:carboxymethylenebutenolidase